MTREEAINTWVIPAIKNTWNEKKCKEILKALEQEPCEDAVSRQYLIDIATKDGAYDYVSAQEIANAPSVNPQPNKEDIHREREQAYMCGYEDASRKYRQEPKTAYWIEYTRVLIPEPINRWEQAWYCSECGYGNQECEDGSAWLEWGYCPNCGAKMIEPQESEG